ncbi:hypothetical protein GSI_13312 [Ganoderma sinense ZZ0214-1]|uniref:Bacteriophage T5 Orf172 DNA-binding domain-containing protein n=1 Tax=Ganoderma sinense ZZ0214-1 TaxID=1077348 RepID=A0A2G8RV78_9APHY|nr:hypothetical protein GSI_13312 [Ganoderma sinense ZZ0214-1]
MVRCNGMTHRDRRCKRNVDAKKAILYPRSASLAHYCRDHLSAGLKNPTFCCLKYRNRVIEYNDYISTNLEDRTQVLLRERMRTPPHSSDTTGYIYGLRLEDPAHPDLVHFKVGRTNSMNRRTAEHLHNCPSGRPVLLGYYPRPPNATDAELSLARIKPGRKVPFARMLEELVHLQLADVAANADPSGVVVPGQRLGANQARRPCIDCGHVHDEIFTFHQLPGALCGLEWEILVLPVIETLGKYVCELV